MSKRTRIRSLIFFLSMPLILLLLIPIPRKVDYKLSCTILDQKDPGYRGEVTMAVQGTYTDYWLLKDHFEGRIYLPEHDLYGGCEPVFRVDIGVFDHMNLMYLDAAGMPHYPGSFYASEDFKTCFLWLMVPNSEKPNISSSRYFISYPDQSLEQLYSIIDGK